MWLLQWSTNYDVKRSSYLHTKLARITEHESTRSALRRKVKVFFFISCTARLVLCTLVFFCQLNSLWITKKCYLFARNDLFKSTRATWHGRKELLKKCRFIKYSNWLQIVRKENYFYKYVLVKFTIINAPFNMKVNQSTALRIRVF